jgi:putative transposase
MSYIRIWIHAVWGTKNHAPILKKEIRHELFHHVQENAKTKQIKIDAINGYLDHVHCLLSLNSESSISKTMQLIKGESAHWANQKKISKSKLDWADEYFAVSVSESVVDKVREYIRNQEVHHKKESFSDEYKKFISRYGFSSHDDREG